jgi:hypothetical protein
MGKVAKSILNAGGNKATLANSTVTSLIPFHCLLSSGSIVISPQEQTVL